MSLRKFHVVFITLATLCMASFALWCFLPQQGGGIGMFASGGLSVVFALVTAVYGIWFYRNKLSGLLPSAE